MAGAVASRMLYFTGSAALGVKMRLKAIELGLTLSEYGLENRKTGEKVKASCEQDIFSALGMSYLEPNER
ncbi:putative DNA polymerase family X [Symbiodinium microadriaticum]|uniref:DNA polymerase n=1 Tax=Symbiodinium microadriaticum TaxID=2951 RepID=A0A1Q9D0G2_SYMMI|nr:putative DNA polymerase family X [Symbiodinium microadriaticum]